MNFLQGLRNILSAWFGFWINIFWSPIVQGLFWFWKKVFSNLSGWLCVAAAAVIVIAGFIFKLVKHLITSIQALSLPDVSVSGPPSVDGLDWAQFLAFINYGFPLDEFITAAAVCMAVYVVALVWRLVKVHIPTMAG